jgi:alpha-galactosidase
MLASMALGHAGVPRMMAGRLASLSFGDLEDTAVAVHWKSSASANGFPQEADWLTAPALHFRADWQGRNADAQRETQVRLLWTSKTLFLRFQARYRSITVFSDSAAGGRRDQLWDRDVAEVFLQPDSGDPLRYMEFEVSPNGMWIDLELSHGEKRDLQSGLKCHAAIDSDAKTWTAGLALPMNLLTREFDPAVVWRVNFFRVEGAAEPRFYSAWRPTGTPKPNFHVPEAFGSLIFREAA